MGSTKKWILNAQESNHLTVLTFLSSPSAMRHLLVETHVV